MAVSDAIAGLSERLRSYRVWSQTHQRYDAVELALEAATQIDALQAALDRVARVDNSLAKQLSQSIAANATLSARVKELEAVNRLLDDTGDLLQARVKELEAENKRLLKYMVPISKDGNHVFIDGTGDVEIDHEGALRSRATRAEQERDEAYELAAGVAEQKVERYVEGMSGVDVRASFQRGYRWKDGPVIAAAIRRLAAGDEKENIHGKD